MAVVPPVGAAAAAGATEAAAAGVAKQSVGSAISSAIKDYAKQQAIAAVKDALIPKTVQQQIGAAYDISSLVSDVLSASKDSQALKEDSAEQKRLVDKLNTRVDGIAVQVNRNVADIAYLKVEVNRIDFKLRNLEAMVDKINQDGLKVEKKDDDSLLKDLINILGFVPQGAAGSLASRLAKSLRGAGGAAGGLEGAIRGAKMGAKLGFGVAALIAIYKAWSQISALSPNLDHDQYTKEVTKIIAKLLDDVSITVVSGVIGGMLGGAIPIPIVGNVAGFVAGAAAGYALEYAIGDSYDQIVDAVVDYMWIPAQQQKGPQTNKQPINPRGAGSGIKPLPKTPSTPPPPINGGELTQQEALNVIKQFQNKYGRYGDKNEILSFAETLYPGRSYSALIRAIEKLEKETSTGPQSSLPQSKGVQYAALNTGTMSDAMIYDDAANKVIEKSYNLSFNEKTGIGGKLTDYSITDNSTGETFSKKDGLSILHYLTIKRIKDTLKYVTVSDSRKNELLQSLDTELENIKNQIKNKSIKASVATMSGATTNISDYTGTNTTIKGSSLENSASIAQKQSVLPDQEEKKEAQNYKLLTQGLLSIESKNNIIIDSKNDVVLKAIREIELDAPQIRFTQQGLILSKDGFTRDFTSKANAGPQGTDGATGAGSGNWNTPGGTEARDGTPMPRGTSVYSGGGSGGAGFSGIGGGGDVDAAPVKALTAGQQQVFDKIRSGQMSVNDPSAAFLKNMKPEQLAAMGVKIGETKDGDKYYTRAEISDSQAIESLKAKAVGGKAGLNKDSKLIVTDASNLKNAMGIDSRQYNAFREAMVSIESGGGNYGIRGGSSNRFSGAYQIGGQEIIEVAKRLGIDAPVVRRGDGKIVASDAFLKNPELQEKFFDEYTLMHHEYLIKNNKKYAQMSPEEQLKVLGYAHNQGAGGASKWLNTGQVGSDAHGTAGTKYYDRIGKQLEATRGQTDMTPEQLANFKPTEQQIADEKASIGQKQQQARIDIAGVTQTANDNQATPVEAGPVNVTQVIEASDQGLMEARKQQPINIRTSMSFATPEGSQALSPLTVGSGRSSALPSNPYGFYPVAPKQTLQLQQYGGRMAYRMGHEGELSFDYQREWGGAQAYDPRRPGKQRDAMLIHEQFGNNLRSSGCIVLDAASKKKFDENFATLQQQYGEQLFVVNDPQHGMVVLPKSELLALATDPSKAKSSISRKFAGTVQAQMLAREGNKGNTEEENGVIAKVKEYQARQQQLIADGKLDPKNAIIATPLPQSPKIDNTKQYQTVRQAEAALRRYKPSSALLPEAMAYGDYAKSRFEGKKIDADKVKSPYLEYGKFREQGEVIKGNADQLQKDLDFYNRAIQYNNDPAEIEKIKAKRDAKFKDIVDYKTGKIDIEKVGKTSAVPVSVEEAANKNSPIGQERDESRMIRNYTDKELDAEFYGPGDSVPVNEKDEQRREQKITGRKPEPATRAKAPARPAAGIGPGNMSMPTKPKIAAPEESPEIKRFQNTVAEKEQDVRDARARATATGGYGSTSPQNTIGNVTHSPESQRASPGSNGYGDQKQPNQDLVGICTI